MRHVLAGSSAAAGHAGIAAVLADESWREVAKDKFGTDPILVPFEIGEVLECDCSSKPAPGFIFFLKDEGPDEDGGGAA